MSEVLAGRSLSDQTTAAIREVLAGRRRGPRSALLFAGPAVIASIAYMDPGNFATNIQAGAKFGYALLWVVVMANLIAMLFQALSAKLGIVTGRNLAEMCRDQFPRPAVYAMWAASEVAAMATDLAESLGGAIGLALLFHLPLLVGMVITFAVSYGILSFGGRGFRPMELIIGALIGVIGISYLIEVFIAPVAWGQAGLHAVLPSLPNAEALTIAVGIIGATVMPHAVYLHSSLTQDRAPGRNARERRALLRFSNGEVIIALSIAGLVNMAMLMMASAAFHAGHPEVAEIETAYHSLTPLLGAGAAVVFLISLMASGLSSSTVGTMAGQVIMQGFVGFRIPLWLRRLVTMVPALVVVALGANATQALVLSQVVLSFALPIPMIALVLFTRRRDIMGEFVNSRLMSAAAITGTVVIVALNIILLLQIFGVGFSVPDNRVIIGWPAGFANVPLMPRPILPCAIAMLLFAAPVYAEDQQEPVDFWHQDTLTGDWGGLRTQLANQGISISLSYTAEVFGNVAGGMKQGASYDGLLEPQIDVDLEKLVGWEGASFRASMLQGHGPSMSTGWVGNLLNVSGTVVVPPATRLYNLWLQQNLFGDALSIRGGIENVDAEFITSTTASVFMNSTFGWPGWTALDLPGGGPAFPLSAPFMRVKLSQAPEGFYAQAAVFSGDPTGHNGSNSPDVGIPSGTVVSFSGGAFIIAEGGYTVNQVKDAKGPPMTFKLGGWYDTSNHFQDQRYDNTGLSLANPASTGIPLDHAGDWGIYGVADATLYQAADGGALAAFARLAGSPGNRNLISFYADAGVTYKGLVPGRGDDTAGIALAVARIGDNARGLDQDTQFFTGNPLFPVRSNEMVLEVTYQMQLTPWLTLQPDLQAIFRPGGNVLNPDGSIRRNALVLGLRSGITF